MLRPTHTLNGLKIIRPFRWWKTVTVVVSIAVGGWLMLLAVLAFRSTPAERTSGTSVSSDVFLLGSLGLILSAFATALVVCTTQVWALKHYYRTERPSTYYSFLWVGGIIQFFVYFIIIASGAATLSPIGITIFTVYYVTTRRRIREVIDGLEAEQPEMGHVCFTQVHIEKSSR